MESNKTERPRHARRGIHMVTTLRVHKWIVKCLHFSIVWFAKIIFKNRPRSVKFFFWRKQKVTHSCIKYRFKNIIRWLPKSLPNGHCATADSRIVSIYFTA